MKLRTKYSHLISVRDYTSLSNLLKLYVEEGVNVNERIQRLRVSLEPRAVLLIWFDGKMRYT